MKLEEYNIINLWITFLLSIFLVLFLKNTINQRAGIFIEIDK